MSRLLFFTQWYEPEPAFKGQVFASALVKLGYEVEVVTGFPNYPTGKIYPGYRLRWLQRERIDGVSVTRVPLYPSHDRSALRRILNYVSFSFSLMIYGLFFARRGDVIYAYHPPLTVGLAAAVIRFFRRIPLVYDVQDLWPDTLRATGMIRSPLVLRVVSAACRFVYWQADHIAVLSAGFKRRLESRGVPADKVSVVMNWADEHSLRNPLTVDYSSPLLPSFRVMFAGNMGNAQGLSAVLRAAEILASQRLKINFIFIGDGIDANRLKLEAEKLALTNVQFITSQPMSTIGAWLVEADALLVHLLDDPLFEITVPSKTQAYLCVGKPILMAVKGDAADLIEEASAGVIAIPCDAVSIANAARKLAALSPSELREMGHRGMAFYDQRLCLDAGTAQFDRIFRRLIAR
jgi:glycosyltransferase involved in cell wall biosynthesis